MADESLTGMDAGATLGPEGGYYMEWAMRSYFGRINLAWDDKYLLEFNLRSDGSSKFSREPCAEQHGHKWYGADRTF